MRKYDEYEEEDEEFEDDDEEYEYEEEVAPRKQRSGAVYGLTGTTFLTTEIIAAMMHGGVLGVGGGILAAAAVYLKGQDVIDTVQGLIPHDAVTEKLHLPRLQGRSLKDRLFGHFPDEQDVDYDKYIHSPAWEARAKAIRKRDNYTCQDCGATDVRLDVHHLTYDRLGHERDEDLISLCRGCHDAREDEKKAAKEPRAKHPKGREATYPTDDLVAPRKKRKGMFLFSEVLERFTPSLNKIYLGTLEDGTMLFCRAEDLCHVAIAGTTRAGKSSIQRMLVAQLCYAGASVLILNPHHSRYILDKKEDWTPFEGTHEDGTPYLMYPPMECRSYDVIEHYLRQITEVLLPKRKDRFARGLATGKPYFLVLDELPDIVKKVAIASGCLDEIVRQGAKYGIFAISASQDFLVKTLKLESGEARECYRSVYYVGKAPTTARTLLGVPAGEIPESILGQGTVMLRNFKVMEDAGVASVPYVDNDSLYQLLGPSTFTPGAGYDEDEADELVGSMMAREVETEKLPTATSLYTSGVRLSERKQAREQRLRGTGTPTRAQDTELERGIRAYKATRTIDDFQAAMGLETQHQARQLRARVKAELNKEEA